MICEHLIELEHAIMAADYKETSRGQAWSDNCREWVYFYCLLPLSLIREKFKLAECVKEHSHLGTHDGQEAGFVCAIHHDAIMGHHPQAKLNARQFQPA